MDPTGLKSVDDLKATPRTASAKMQFALLNGHLVADGKLLEGNRQEVVWWNGRTKYNSSRPPSPTSPVSSPTRKDWTD